MTFKNHGPGGCCCAVGGDYFVAQRNGSNFWEFDANGSMIFDSRTGDMAGTNLAAPIDASHVFAWESASRLGKYRIYDMTKAETIFTWSTHPYGALLSYAGHGFMTPDSGLLLWNGCYPNQNEWNPDPFEVTKWNSDGTIDWYIADINVEVPKPAGATNDNPRAQPSAWAAFPTNNGGAAFWLRKSSTHYGYIGSGLWWGLYLVDETGAITIVELFDDLVDVSTNTEWTVGCQLSSGTLVLMASEFYAQPAGTPWCEIQLRSDTGNWDGHETLSRNDLGIYRGRALEGCSGPDGEFYFLYWLQDSDSQYQWRVARYDEESQASISETWNVVIPDALTSRENKLLISTNGSLYVAGGYAAIYWVLDSQTGELIDTHVPPAGAFIDPYQLAADGFANTW